MAKQLRATRRDAEEAKPHIMGGPGRALRFLANRIAPTVAIGLLGGIVAAGLFLAFAVTLAVLLVSLLVGLLFGRSRLRVFVQRRRPEGKSRSHAEVLPDDDDSTRP